MSKVNGDDATAVHVHHEVGEVAVTNTQYILTDGDGGRCVDEV